MTNSDTDTTDAGKLFDDLIGLNGPEVQAAAEARERENVRTSEVDQLLAANGISREAIENKTETEAEVPVVEAAEPSNGHKDPAASAFSEKHWTDVLAEEAAAGIAADEDELEDLLPGDIDLGDAKVPEYPVALVNKLVTKTITKEQVYSVLASFRVSISLGEISQRARSIIVTDSSQKALMKEARELRLALKRERIRIDDVGAAIKEPHLRRIQLIDGARKALRDLFEAEESYLREQEDFAKNEAIRIENELREKRFTELTTLEAVIPEGLDLGKLSPEAYEALRSAAETALANKRELERIAEENRIADERAARIENEKLRRKNDRIGNLSQLGMTFDGVNYVHGEATALMTAIENAADDEWSPLYQSLATQINAAKAEEEARNRKRAERSQRISALGFGWNGGKFFYGDDLTFSELDLGKSDEEFEADFTRISQIVAEREKAIAAAREAEQRRETRIRQLVNCGLLPDGEPVTTYIYAGHPDAAVTVQEITELDEPAWTDKVGMIVGHVTFIRQQEATERELLEEIAAAAAERERLEADEAERRRLAPDKEKLDLYFRDIQAVTEKQPAVDSPKAQALLDRFFASVAELVNSAAAEAAKLGD